MEAWPRDGIIDACGIGFDTAILPIIESYGLQQSGNARITLSPLRAYLAWTVGAAVPGMWGADLMRRQWAFLIRWLLACAIVMLLHWPFANYYWTSYQPAPLKTNANGDPYRISGPGGELTEFISAYTCPIALDLPEAAIAALLAILVYCALGRLFEKHNTPTRCRRCAQVLCGLTIPECPTCGEYI